MADEEKQETPEQELAETTGTEPVAEVGEATGTIPESEAVI